MKQRIKMIVASIGVMVAILFSITSPMTAYAVNPFPVCSGNTLSKVCEAQNNDNVFVVLKNVINILLTVIGIVTVIMIIVGGIKYVTSSGDSSGITSAKNTILYALVGLVIAVMAFAIVNFVIAKV